MRRSTCVAPLAGAWIEMTITTKKTVTRTVAPLAGAWIEIDRVRGWRVFRSQSLPSRERGLKSVTRSTLNV